MTYEMSIKMMNETRLKEINQAYLFLRTNNTSIDDQTLEFMRDVSIRAASGELCLISDIQALLKRKMENIETSNSYRWKVNQTAQWAVSILEDIQIEVAKLKNN